jgi:pimeloyl-ACP methyl ester carboxylesterase
MQARVDVQPNTADAWKRGEVRVDGARVHYVEAGQGEPVLLLHGYPQSHLCWRKQIPVLAARHRVIAPDWPGFGRSEACISPPPTYDVEVGRIALLAERLGLSRFNLIAHDYGGFLGLGHTLRHPGSVLRLALLNSRAHGTFRPGYYDFSQRVHWIANQRIARALASTLPIGRLHRRGLRRYRALGCFDAAIEDEYLGWMDAPAGRARYFHFFAHYPVPTIAALAAGLPGIACPTAIIWGERDPYIPRATPRELATRIPNATLTSLADADHFVMEERPVEVNTALQRLLATPLTGQH